MQIFPRFPRRKRSRRGADQRRGALEEKRSTAAERAENHPGRQQQVETEQAEQREAERTLADIDPLIAALSPDVPPADTPHVPVGSLVHRDDAPRDPALRGTATVARLTPSGPDLDGARVYDLLLSVELPEREPYQFLHRQLIADASLGSWKPGSQLSVRVMADNPSDLIVVG